MSLHHMIMLHHMITLLIYYLALVKLQFFVRLAKSWGERQWSQSYWLGLAPKLVLSEHKMTVSGWKACGFQHMYL